MNLYFWEHKGIESMPQTQVWNIKGLRHWVAKILGLENQSLWQDSIPLRDILTI